jgi:hypothetical protein
LYPWVQNPLPVRIVKREPKKLYRPAHSNLSAAGGMPTDIHLRNRVTPVRNRKAPRKAQPKKINRTKTEPFTDEIVAFHTTSKQFLQNKKSLPAMSASFFCYHKLLLHQPRLLREPFFHPIFNFFLRLHISLTYFLKSALNFLTNIKMILDFL